MQTKFYTLPEWDFVGGGINQKTLTLYEQKGVLYNLPNGIARLSIIPFVNRTGEPTLRKEFSIVANENSVHCKVEIVLSAEETVNLSGKYIYQIMVRDAEGNIAAPQQGTLLVYPNIDKSFVTG